MITLSVAKDFTRYPGPRYRKDGPFSGEQFREEQLVPALRTAIHTQDIVVVLLDDVAGYGSSFLEEAFGGLVRVGFPAQQLSQHLRIQANTDRFQHHKLRAQTYLTDATRRP